MEQHQQDPLWKHRFSLLAAAGFFLHLALALSFDLTPDEAYYWELSRRLDWSYFDHPPLVAYSIAVFRTLLGDIPLAVRLPAILFHLGTTILVFDLGSRLENGAKTGFLAALFLQISVAGNALGFITTPDAPLSFCWALASWGLVKWIRSDASSGWIWLGLGLALGAMAKYNMVFFVPGAVLALLAFKVLQGRFLGGKLWFAASIAALGTIPVFYWNASNDWISFRFQLSHGFKPAERIWSVSFGEFLGGQLGTIGPVLFPLLWFVALSVLWQSWKKDDHLRFTLAAIALPMMAFFALNSFRSKVEANWPQVAYLTAMPLAAEWLLASNRERWLRATVFTTALLGVLSLVHAYTLVIPLKPSSDITTRLYGWSQLGERVREIDRQTDGKAVFFGQGAPFSALLGFYGNLPPDRVGEANGVGNWKFWWKNRSLANGSNAVYVDTGNFSEAISWGRQYFNQVNASQTYPILARGREIRQIIFTPLADYRGGLKYDVTGLVRQP